MRLELAHVAIQFGGAVKSHVIGAVDHRLRRPNLRLPDGSGRLDVDDHAVIGVDQIIGGVGEEGMAVVRAVAGKRINGRAERDVHSSPTAARSGFDEIKAKPIVPTRDASYRRRWEVSRAA